LTTRKSGSALGLAATLISVALAAPAYAAPAGDEYLPKVPKAEGKEVVANPKQGAGASVLSPSVRGATPPTASATSDSSHTSSGAEKQPKDKHAKRAKPSANTVAPASSSSDGGGSAIFNPIILLVIAGVIAAAAGMTLRRRQDGGDQPSDGEGDAPDHTKHARPTPDGEIVASGEKAR
jgi:hypothetical protein